MQNLLGAIIAAIVPQIVQNIIPTDNPQIQPQQNPQIAQRAISAPSAHYCQHCGQPLHQQQNPATSANLAPIISLLTSEIIKEIAPPPKRKPAAKKKIAIKPQQKQRSKR